MRLPQRAGRRLDRLVVVLAGFHRQGRYLLGDLPFKFFSTERAVVSASCEPPGGPVRLYPSPKPTPEVGAVNSSGHRMPQLGAGE
jgi:hypothetical protein